MDNRRFILRLSLFWIVDLAVISFLFFGILPSTRSLIKGAAITRTASNGKAFKFDVGPLNKNYVGLHEISPYLRYSVLSLEDAKFYEHRGIDVEEVTNALDSFARGRKLRGASTITQQLSKNLFLTHERSFKRKFIEAFISIKLEMFLSKNKILELYLNSIEWGHGLIGVKQATLYYFRKRPKDLSVKEAVFLASIIPNPARFGKIDDSQLPKRFVRRQMARALQSLFEQDLIDLNQYQEALSQPLEVRP